MRKLTISQTKHLLKLLHMRYTAEEMAGVVQIEKEFILEACKAGCPHEIDPEGETWIIGTDLQNWLEVSGKWRGKYINGEAELINRNNYFDIQNFMNYRIRVRQLDPLSIRARRMELNHLLQWAGSTPFEKADKIDLFFPTYLLTARNDGLEKPLAPASLKRICSGSRIFFKWVKAEYPDRFTNISSSWIEAIQPKKSKLQSVLKIHELWSLEEVQKIARLQARNVVELRDRAAICFLFLSAMRATAFVTLPVSCVDIDARKIEQLPEKGVITKNRKAAITSLLPIDELLAVVREWDALVRASTRPESPWFALLDEKTNTITDPDPDKPMRSAGRRAALIEGMHDLCERAGVPYRSPHKLRHGHAVYGIKAAKDMRELKAVSQNMMHSSISITDGVYGSLTAEDVNATMSHLGVHVAPAPQPASDMNTLLLALAKLQANPELLKTVLST